MNIEARMGGVSIGIACCAGDTVDPIGKTDVEIEHKAEPDMIGETYWVHYECCGHDGEARNSHCEYDSSGRIVDIG